MYAAILVIVGILCYTGQGFFKKLYAIQFKGPEEICGPLFSVLYGVLVGVGTWAYNGFQFQMDKYTMIIGIMNGFALYLYNIAAIKACQCGPYTFQNLIMSFSGILAPLLVSTIWWKNALSIVQIIGLVCLFLSLYLYNDKGEDATKLTRVFVIWVMINALANSFYSAAIPMQQRHTGNTLRNEMIIVTFVVSAFFSAAQFFFTRKKDTKLTLAIGGRAWFWCILTCICAGVAINTIMLAIKYLDPGIVYATENGGIMLCQVALCVLVLHEKQTKRQWVGIVLATISLVLLNI